MDGITWEALPPPTGNSSGQVGGIQRIGDKYYVLLSEGRIATADKPEGPFTAQAKNHNVPGGNTYFPRFFHTARDGVLVNHHVTGGQVHFAPLKAIQVDAEGILCPVWWSGNERMKHRKIDLKPPESSRRGAPSIIMFGNRFDLDDGVIIERTIALPRDALSGLRGIYLYRGNGEGHLALLTRDSTMFGRVRANGSGLVIEETVSRDVRFPSPAKFRLLMKKDMMEFYLADYLMHIRRVSCCGREGLVPGGAAEGFSDLRA